MADKKSKWRLYTLLSLKCKGLKITQLPKGKEITNWICGGKD